MSEKHREFSAEDAGQIAWRALDGRPTGTDTAFVAGSPTTLADEVLVAVKKRQPFEPSSAIVELVQGLWSTFGKEALTLVRRPLYATGALTEMDHGIIKVAAKRWRETQPTSAAGADPIHAIRFLSAPLDDSCDALADLLRDTYANRRFAPKDAMALASEIAQCETQRHAARAESDRPVGAVLLDAEGRLLGAGANRAGRDRTRHAEVNLLQEHWRRTKGPVPVGSQLITTLKPCKMCAGMLWTAAEDPLSLRVTYLEDDPGSFGRSTVLTAGSFERRRACARISNPPADAVTRELERHAPELHVSPPAKFEAR